MENSEDPDEMDISSGSALFAKIKTFFKGTENHINLDILPSSPLISTMNHPRLFVSNHMEEFISLQRVIYCKLTKGDLKLRHAAMVRAESKHLNIAPNNINLPILEKKNNESGQDQAILKKCFFAVMRPTHSKCHLPPKNYCRFSKIFFKFFF